MILLKNISDKYKNIKVIESKYKSGIARFNFNKIPDKYKITKDTTGLVLYLTSPTGTIKIGKIKKIVTNNDNPYVEIYEEKMPDYRPTICELSGAMILDKDLKIYKKKLKGFDV